MLLIGAVILVSAASVGIWTYLQLNAIILRNAFRALTEKAAVKALVLEQHFSEFSRDALYQSYTSPVHEYVKAYRDHTTSAEARRELQRWRTRMEENFVSMLTAKPFYFQIRFIRLDNQGRELVRVERRGNRIETVPDDELQPKGPRT
jgi:hypothetical protein